MGEDGRPLVTRTTFRYPADAVQPRPGAGAEPDRAVVAAAARRASSGFCAQVSIDTAAIQYESDELHAAALRRRHGDRLLRLGDAGRQADAVLRRPRQPGQGAAVRDQRRPRRGHAASRSRPPSRAADRGESLDYDDVVAALRQDARLARRDLRRRAQLSSTTCTTSTPTSASRWRCTTAPSCARWPAASPACRSPPTRCRRSGTRTVRPVRDETRPGRRLRRRGRVPDLRQRRRPGRRRSPSSSSSAFMEQDPPAADLPRRGAHAVGADDHVQRGLRQAHRQHARRPPRRRAVRAGRQPDERPRHATAWSPRRCRWRSCRTSEAQDGISLTDHGRPARRSAARRTSASATWSACSTATSAPAAST